MFISSVVLFLLWTFTRLKDHYIPIPFTGVQADGRYIIAAAFILFSFIITFIENWQTKFKNKRALQMLIVQEGLLFLLVSGFYYLRLVEYAFANIVVTFFSSKEDGIKASTEKMPAAIDFVVYGLVMVIIVLIIYTIIRLRKSKI